MIGKKGDSGVSIQESVFYGAEIFVGALIILGSINIVSNQMQDMTAKSVATDLELIISTLSFFSSDVYTNYPFSKEIVGVSIMLDERINKYELRVLSRKGNYRTYIDVADGVLIESASFSQPSFIPIYFKHSEKVLSFNIGKFNDCDKYTGFSSDSKFRLHVPLNKGFTVTETESLNKISQSLLFKDSLKDSDKSFFNQNANIIIELWFYDDAFVNVSSNLQGGELFGCYMEKVFYDLNMESNIFEEQNKIIISLGKHEVFMNKMKTFKIDELYSEITYSVLERSLV